MLTWAAFCQNIVFNYMIIFFTVEIRSIVFFNVTRQTYNSPIVSSTRAKIKGFL